MQVTPAPVTKLIDEFSRLPGIGPKSASRLTFYLLRTSAEQSLALSKALRELHEQVVFCSACFNIAESDPCSICSNENRDRSIICVVEEPLNVLAIERTRDYQGLYHVLHGHIAPSEGIGPEDLKIGELVDRVRMSDTPVAEIIIATNPNLEGEATAMYIARQFQSDTSSIKVTRLARGLPMGGDLEYADEITLSRALSGRSEI
ncbi:MAG: recombination mediator RecR [Anaerolineae bacterium]|nr:recombination mediator RecR [Anaerolineae bacterium]